MKKLVKAGKLELILKSRNAKYYALPAIAAEYKTVTSATPAGS